MKDIKSVQRIACKLLNCGKNKLWMDPSEKEKIIAATNAENIKQLIADKVILQRPDKHNSRARARKLAEGREKGRHMGLGSRRGTKNARCPTRDVWIKNIRTMRKALKDMKLSGELNIEEYRMYRQQAKGLLFKNKNVMVDAIAKRKAEIERMKELEQQAAALNMSKNN